MSEAQDELDRVLRGNIVATYNRNRGRGGEWDTIRALPLRQRQRLTSAGFFSKGGMLPDVASSLWICPAVGGVDDTCAAMEWYIRTCRRALVERRREKHRARHLRIAREYGDATYYARRQRLAREAGYSSLWAYRKAKRWTENRTPRWKPKTNSPHSPTTSRVSPNKACSSSTWTPPSTTSTGSPGSLSQRPT